MSAKRTERTLLIGIGNDTRGDDGLGWRFVERLTSYYPHVDMVQRYQLQVEDAELISGYEQVIFVDAAEVSTTPDFIWRVCEPVSATSFSTHRIDPEMVMYLAHEIFGSEVKGSVLAIGGNRWDIHQGLSPTAEENLNKAAASFRQVIAS